MKKFNLSKKEMASLGIAATGLGVSTTNMVNNMKNRKEGKEFQEKQLKAIDKLTNSIDKVDESLKVDQKKKPIRFFQKSHSYTKDLAIKGAAMGGVLSGPIIPFLPEKIGATSETIKIKDGETKTKWTDDPDYKHPELRKAYNGTDKFLRGLLLEVGGTVIGAAFGAIIGGIMDLSNAINRKRTVNDRLMKGILENLKKSGYREGKDFTRDPKIANLLKTKVCLVISKSSDSLKLLINTVNDGKLRSINSGITKNLPNMSVVTEKATDRFNELNITTMTTNNGDSTWVASVAERFIKAGYPVYLVEVG